MIMLTMIKIKENYDHVKKRKEIMYCVFFQPLFIDLCYCNFFQLLYVHLYNDWCATVMMLTIKMIMMYFRYQMNKEIMCCNKSLLF